MTNILLILSLGFAGIGLWLVTDFLLWRAAGQIVVARISGLQGKKDKGLRLPVVSFEKEDGTETEAKAERIDRVLYLLNKPEEGDFTTVIYQENEEEIKARIYGYLNLMVGVFLLFPLLVTVALKMEESTLLAQVVYTLIFGVIVVGGWVLLKLIQRYY